MRWHSSEWPTPVSRLIRICEYVIADSWRAAHTKEVEWVEALSTELSKSELFTQ
jgi:hypothetical protein